MVIRNLRLKAENVTVDRVTWWTFAFRLICIQPDLTSTGLKRWHLYKSHFIWHMEEQNVLVSFPDCWDWCQQLRTLWWKKKKNWNIWSLFTSSFIRKAINEKPSKNVYVRVDAILSRILYKSPQHSFPCCLIRVNIHPWWLKNDSITLTMYHNRRCFNNALTLSTLPIFWLYKLTMSCFLVMNLNKNIFFVSKILYTFVGWSFYAFGNLIFHRFMGIIILLGSFFCGFHIIHIYIVIMLHHLKWNTFIYICISSTLRYKQKRKKDYIKRLSNYWLFFL